MWKCGNLKMEERRNVLIWKCENVETGKLISSKIENSFF